MENKLEQLRATIQNLLVERQTIEKGITEHNMYFEKFLQYQNVEKLDRLMLLELIDKIYVNEDKTIKIEFNYENQYLLIMDYIERNKGKIRPQKTLKKKK